MEGVHRRFLRAPDGSVSFDAGAPEFNSGDFVPVEVKAGSLVLLHGANVHLRWVWKGWGGWGRLCWGGGQEGEGWKRGGTAAAQQPAAWVVGYVSP